MGKIRSQLDGLLNQEMDRKSFLRYSGGIVLALIGVTGLLRVLLSTRTANPLIDELPKKTHGYGSSRYGQ